MSNCTDLNNSEAKGFIQGWLHKGPACVSYHAIHLPVLHRIFLSHQPPAALPHIDKVDNTVVQTQNKKNKSPGIHVFSNAFRVTVHVL